MAPLENYWLNRAKGDLEKSFEIINVFMSRIDYAKNKGEITEAEYKEIRDAFDPIIKDYASFVTAYDKVLTRRFEK